MNASIEVLGVSGGDVPSYDEYTTHQSGQRLHVRLNVAQQGSAVRDFDGVTVTLHGAVNSQIGSKAALEKVLCLSRTTRYSDFDANLSSKDSAAASMHSEVTFDLPEIIPSLSLSGTTEYTKYSALRDRHQVTGTCNVRYWLEADFKSNGRVARRLSLPVDFSKLLKPSQMTVLASGRTSCTRQPVDVQRRGWRFKRGSKPAPAMTFEVLHELGVVASAPKGSGAGHQRLSIPLTLSASRSDSNSFICTEGITNVSLQTTWHTRKTFGTSRLVADDYRTSTAIRKGTVVRQYGVVSFPPFFKDATTDHASCSSTTQFDLILPDSVSDSSVETDLVSVSYELEIEAAFDLMQQHGRVVPCRSKLRIPLQVSVT